MIYVRILNRLDRKELQSLIHFSGEKIYSNIIKESNRKYRMMCDRMAHELLFDTIKVLGIINASNVVVMSLSGYAYFNKNEIHFPVPVLFPFTDLESIKGIIINTLNQSFLCLVGSVGLLGIEITTCIIKDTLRVSTAAICYSIDEMSELILCHEANQKISIDLHFRNIIIQIQDFDR